VVTTQTNNTTTLDVVLFTERKRLVRLCAQLTGDATLAEDLAQETLLVAWRNGHQLHH
jgi:DNA-directed RNA polymerase specialized sigma24 family protein